MYLYYISDDEEGDTEENKDRIETKKTLRTLLDGGPYNFGAIRVVQMDYKAKTKTEPTVKKGEVIRTLVGQENNKWAIINYNGTIGLIPDKTIISAG